MLPFSQEETYLLWDAESETEACALLLAAEKVGEETYLLVALEDEGEDEAPEAQGACVLRFSEAPEGAGKDPFILKTREGRVLGYLAEPEAKVLQNVTDRLLSDLD